LLARDRWRQWNRKRCGMMNGIVEILTATIKKAGRQFKSAVTFTVTQKNAA
jgi:hypothetical protein